MKNSNSLARVWMMLALLTSSAATGADPRLHYCRPAEYFEEGLVIGNGKLGANIYGGVAHERLSLNDITLWTGGPDTVNVDATQMAVTLWQVRQALEAEDYVLADSLNMGLQGHYSENYQPLGDLNIRFRDADGNPLKADMATYWRELRIDSALARSGFTTPKGAVIEREYLASSPDSVIALRLQSHGAPLNFTLSLASQLPHSLVATPDGRLEMEGYAAAHSFPGYYGGLPDSLKFEYRADGGTRFLTAVAVDAPDGMITATDSSLTVSAPSEAVVYLSNETSFNGPFLNPATQGKEYRSTARRNVSRAMNRGYRAVCQRHTDDYRQLFTRVSLDLGVTPDSILQLPTDRQLLLYTDSAQRNPDLEELYFQFGRYLLISASRTPGVPANLQGLWNEQLLPPWSSNYTSNINLQENYWGAETTNLGELHEPMLTFVERLTVNGRRAARDFYGTSRGWCLGQNTDIWAMANPVGLQGGNPVWACWTMGGAWTATHIWEHYLFGRDRRKLQQRYDALRGAAEFCLDWLVEKDGYLLTSPGTSPENTFLTPDGQPVSTSYGTTADLAMARECLLDAVAAARELGTDSAFIAEAQAALRRLAPYKIGAQGQLQEWWHDWREAEPHHRHQSHLFGLYPGHHLTPSTTPELAQAAHRTLELRGPESTGWSTGWRINLYARLGDADNAYATLRRLLRYISPTGYRGPGRRTGGGTYPNLLDAHSPFQIDGNFGGSAGIAEMLVQSTPESITLLPALPAAWPTGSVSGLRTRTGHTLSMDWRDGHLTSYTLTPAVPTPHPSPRIIIAR